MKNRLKAGWFVLIAMLPCLVLAASQSVTLKLDKGALSGTNFWPLGAGIPLKEGQAKEVSGMKIRSANGILPAQFEVRTRHPDGSIQWLWTDFQAPAEESYSLIVDDNHSVPILERVKKWLNSFSAGKEKTLPAGGNEVVKSADKVVVKNGILQLTWDVRYATPVKIEWLGNNQPLAEDDGKGIYFIDQNDNRAVLGGKDADLDFKVETKNNLRTVIRIEGWYTRDNGEKVARGIVRYHIFWKQPWLKIDHHFILAKDNDEVCYKEIGVHFPLKKGKTVAALFGVNDGDAIPVTMGNDAGEAYVFQSAYPIYYKPESRFTIGRDGEKISSGKEAAGWADLNNGSAGLVLAVKDFAPQFPKELAAGSNGLTAKLWSGRDGKALDYRPATMAKDWWGDWLNRINMLAIGPKSNRPANSTPEEIKALNPGCVGVARTHELLVGYYAGPQETQRAKTWNNLFQHAPVAYADPRWTCHVGPKTFWPMAAKGEGGEKYADVERFIESWYDEYVVPLKMFPYTGWYDWGKTPDLRYVKEPKENDRIYAQWFRVGINNNYNLIKYLFIGWARSGDRKYLDTARRFNRFNLDYWIIHWSGGKGKRQAGYFAGSQHDNLYWAPSGRLGITVDSEYLTAPALEYLMLDNRWAKDTILLVKQKLMEEFQPTTDFTCQTPDMVLAYMMAIYRIDPDPALKEKIVQLYEAMTDLNGPGGLSEKFFGQIGGHYSDPLYKIPRKSTALIEYADLFGGDKERQIAAKSATKSERKAVCYYCDFYGMSNARAYQWNHEASHLAAARYQVQKLQELFNLYEKLPADEKLEAHFIKNLSKNPLSQGSAHACYYFRETLGKDNKIGLSFATPSAATPFMSLPTAIWALCGYPDYDGKQDAAHATVK